MGANIYFCTDKELIPYTKEDGTTGGCPTLLEIDVLMNFSESNIAHFLSCLGFNPRYYDQPPIALGEFLNACNLYLSSEMESVVDTGKDTVTVKGEKGCTMIHGGRPEGYVRDRVSRLLPFVQLAVNQGATHVYFA